MMKKLLFTLIAAAIANFGAAAQITAGAGYANQITNTRIGDIDADNSSNGFYVGAGFSCPIIAGLSVDPGVYYSYMVSKQSLLETELVTGNTQSHYLTIPINFRYTLKAVDFLDVFAYAGPNFNIGLASTTSASMLGMTVDVNNFGEDGSLRRFDLGLGAGLGFDLFQLVRVSAGYNWGLLNLNKSDNVQTTNAGWHIGVAVLF